MLTSAAPKPVMPKTIDPPKPAAARSAISAGENVISEAGQQSFPRAAVHAPQPVDIAAEGHAMALLQRRGATAQLVPAVGAGRALQADRDHVGVAQRRQRDHRAANRLSDAPQVAIEVRRT